MTSLTTFLLLGVVAATAGDASGPPAANETAQVDRSHFPGATEAFACNFELTGDDELYAMPPGWRRRHGPGYPRYVRIRVDDERSPRAGHSLRVDLNGGAASVFGPAISITPGVDFVLEGYLKTSGLSYDRAWISLTFLDAERLKVSDVVSEKVGGTSPWQKVIVGPVSPPSWATQMEVRLNVAPSSDANDLRGTASFGNVWVGKLPRVVLTARTGDSRRQANGAASDPSRQAALRGADDVSFLVFVRGRPIETACLVSGLAASQYETRLELLDADGQTLAEHREAFAGPTAGQPVAGNSHRTAWQIPSGNVGFYRLRARIVPTPLATGNRAGGKMESNDGYVPSAELSLAIVDPELPSPDSEFGWSLDLSDAHLGLIPMSDLLRQAGIHWVKYPFICPVAAKQGKEDDKTNSQQLAAQSKSADAIEPLISFSDRLADAGIRIVGVLYPPTAAEPGLKPYQLLAVEAFSANPSAWYPAIEPVLARMATEIRYWQVGDDSDPGWNACRDLPAAVSRVKAQLDHIGQDVSVGIAWNLRAPLPISESASKSSAGHSTDQALPLARAPWRFLSFACNDTFTDYDLAVRLDETGSSGVNRWLTVDVLPQGGAPISDRIGHLVNRLVTAKMHGAEAIFFAHPIDAERGLVGRDGSPTELFLPWRSTALMLGGAAYAGDVDLPGGGGAIHCFTKQGDYIGVLPGGSPEKESVWLGDHLKSHDVWGQVSELRQSRGVGETEIDVGRVPSFLTNLDPAITNWQLHVAFTPQSLPSIPSTVVPVALEVKNTLQRAVSGRVRITGPKNWSIVPQEAEFRMGADGKWSLPLQVALPNDVIGGRQMVALEFTIQSDRTYHFTMYRALEVTLGNVVLAGRAALSPSGDVQVRQSLVNQDKRYVSFRCDLLTPDRRRQSSEIQLQPGAKSEFTYRLPDGRELLGKSLWLRAEEIGGQRVLNYEVKVPLGDLSK